MDISNVNDTRVRIRLLATWVERVTMSDCMDKNNAHVDVANFLKKVTSQTGERIDILYSLQS